MTKNNTWIILLIFIALIAGYLAGYDDAKQDIEDKENEIWFHTFYNMKEAKQSLPRLTTDYFCFQLKNGDVGCVIGEKLSKEI